MRAAAFAAVERLEARYDPLMGTHLREGFVFEGQHLALVNLQRGIFKPRGMPYLRFIKTVFPRPGARVWYDDQREVHAQIVGGREAVDYAFMGTDPEAAENRWLREASERGVPLIYFLGVAPGQHQAVRPVFVAGWDAGSLRARLVVGEGGAAPTPPETAVERRSGLRLVRGRLHQARFRAAMIEAYGGRCVVSRLPEPRLLDAAHIVADRDAARGQPVVPNGLPLSNLHHAAFDAQLIGIDPDFRLHVSDRLLAQDDAPTLAALKDLHGETIHLPRRERDRPDCDRLAARFGLFRAGA